MKSNLKKKKLKWQNPLNFAQKIAQNYTDQDWVFLYSGLNSQVKNSISYITLFVDEKIICDDFLRAKKLIEESDKDWFGYLSYELGEQFEKLPKTHKSFINLPKIHLINFSLIFKFDHQKKILTAFFDKEEKLREVLNYKAYKAVNKIPRIKKLQSNFTDKSYLKSIDEIREMIAQGDFYQANLTRKFFGEFDKKLNQKEAFILFLELTKSSAANYSSFLNLDKNFIISSSPELFLSVKNNRIISRPIKGTRPRSSIKKQDEKNKLELKNSAKERAENLMIVDLVRNDLSKFCKAGSVKVRNLFHINSYQTVHHMSSEISGKIMKNFTVCDALQHCFPAGSMTGAPKIKAMEIIAKKEKINRGIYSGAIGMIEGKKNLNLAVVIRTLIICDNKFEMQFGGGITYNSIPQDELSEVYSKAKTWFKILKLSTKKKF